MYNCPECDKEMTWQSDEKIGTEIYSQFSCSHCDIHLTKISTYEEEFNATSE